MKVLIAKKGISCIFVNCGQKNKFNLLYNLITKAEYGG